MDTSPYEPLNTIVDSSSSESVNGEYDVFLSFHGEDTRNNFVCHLYKELTTKGIHTFMDDKRLEQGKPISPSLIEAIEKSKISIVVFSPNYAASSWCLDELLKIDEWMKTKKQLVLPVFVNVDPSNVQKQEGTFAEAFRNHQSNFGSVRIQRWRDALSNISTISGWDSRNCSVRNQAELIQFIAEKVSKRLICKEPSPENPLVGIDSFMMDIDGKLDLKCNDVQMLGIWGPGGIGKTTIADFIYHKYSSRYEACCFLRDIKDMYKQIDGVIALQKDLIFQTLSERDLNIRSKNEGYNVIKRLKRKKVLIVLDDVNEQEQLEDLANKTWFGGGSRIIITTRDKRSLNRHVESENIYAVQTLEREKALQLFSLHAFNENEPPMEFLDLSNRFVTFTQCLPLALKVLGRSLNNRKKEFWESELERLKINYGGLGELSTIYQSLKISYDGLKKLEKKVFLDVAFFFDGYAKAKVEDILHQCGLYPKSALPILEERALLTFSFDKYLNSERIYMHDLIKMMGHEIVRAESKDPNYRSRFCDPKEIKDVLTKKTEVTSTEGISLNMKYLCESIDLEPNAFKEMKSLRILTFIEKYYGDGNGEIQILEGLGSLPEALMYFDWVYFPLKYWPFTSFGENLVVLLLQQSKLVYLWEGEMEFKKLKKIDLRFSEKLKVFPDLSRAPNIEEIILRGCKSCYKVSSLRHLQKLKILDFFDCHKLDKLPMLPSSLVEFYHSTDSVTELPLGFQFLVKLEILQLRCQKFTLSRFTGFLQCVGELKLLKLLDLARTPIVELPQTIEHLHELQSLNLYGCTDLVRLPSCLHMLASLQKILIERCNSLVLLPKLPPSLKELRVDFCESLETLECNNWNHFKQLVELRFVGCDNLDDRSCNEIMECVRVMSHSYREYFEHKQIECFVPRKEIPEWFEYESCESSITIKLPESLHQIRGFAFGAAFTDFNGCSVKLIVISELINLETSLDLDMLSLDHVVVWDYHFNGAEKKALTAYLGCELQFNISFDDHLFNESIEDNFISGSVKKWGVHMIPDQEVSVI